MGNAAIQRLLSGHASTRDLRNALGFTAKQTPAAGNISLPVSAARHHRRRKETYAVDDTDLSEFANFHVSLDGRCDGWENLRKQSSPRHREDTSLWRWSSHEVGIPLAECAVSEKTNEIPVSLELLKAFDVANTVITTDALLTQRKFCQEILDQHAAYCLPVKANQRQLYDDIRDLFEPFDETDPSEVETRRFENLHAEIGAHLQTYTDVENNEREDHHTHPHHKHPLERTHRLARAPASLSIYDAPRAEEHRTGQGPTCNMVSRVCPPNTPRQPTYSRSAASTGRLRINSIGSEMPSFERMPPPLELAGSRKSWQRCETPHSPSYASLGHTKITDALQLFAAKPKLAVNLIK